MNFLLPSVGIHPSWCWKREASVIGTRPKSRCEDGLRQSKGNNEIIRKRPDRSPDSVGSCLMLSSWGSHAGCLEPSRSFPPGLLVPQISAASLMAPAEKLWEGSSWLSTDVSGQVWIMCCYPFSQERGRSETHKITGMHFSSYRVIPLPEGEEGTLKGKNLQIVTNVCKEFSQSDKD